VVLSLPSKQLTRVRIPLLAPDYHMNESLFSPQDVNDNAINELLRERVIGVSGLRKYIEKVGSKENIIFGAESIVVAIDEVVYAFDYFLKISQERQQLLLWKHNLLNLIFPDHFPRFYKAVGEGIEPHGYSYTVRQRVKKVSNVEVTRKEIEGIYEPIIKRLGELGIDIYIDTGSTRNFSFGVVGDQKVPSLYYLDRLDVADISSRWESDLILLRDFLGSDIDQQVILQEILISMEKSHNDLDKKGEGFKVEFL
jgi:hypothetical protein